MKSFPTLNLMAWAVLSAMAVTPCVAQNSHYFYGGLGAGQSREKLDEVGITNHVLANSPAINAISHEDRDKTFKIFGGYQFTPYLGLEAGYFNLGKFGFISSTAPAGTLNGEIKVKGVNLDLVGTLPVTENFALLGRIGAQYARTYDTFTSTGTAVVTDPGPAARKTNYKLGAGLQYAFNPSFMMRGEAERYHIDDAAGGHGNVNVLTVSLVFPFGREMVPVAAATPPAAYVAPPEPVALPAPLPAPPPVIPRRVSFTTDSLFTFDQSTLRPEGRRALDQFVTDLSGTVFNTISVEGHTDRLGSVAYNQTLSLQRAEAVKTYLVSVAGVNPEKIMTFGKGESDPVTKPADCNDRMPKAKLIACLQADRRVEVEVSGTR